MDNTKAHNDLKNRVIAKIGLFFNRAWVYGTPTGVFKALYGNSHISVGITGQADISGMAKITITPEMVGTEIAVPLGIEIKTGTGRLSKGQRTYRDKMLEFGGKYYVVRSIEDAEKIIDELGL